MQLPATIPDQFNEYAAVATDQQLIEILKKDTNRLLQFFTFACDDETWCSNHPEFIDEILIWLTEQVLANDISYEQILPVTAAIRRHSAILYSHLPINLTIKALDDRLPINSLMFQGGSPLFYYMMHKSCFENKSRTFVLPRIFLKDLKIIEEYLYKGEVVDLWRLVESDLKKVLNIAYQFELNGLGESCQKILVRYITPKNVFESLKITHDRSWGILRERCSEMINSLNLGIEISLPGPASLSCYLEGISGHSMDSFREVMPLITQLICGPTVIDDSGFSALLEECPKLISLDIGRTNAYSFQLARIPFHIRELIAINSIWLNDTYFKMLIADCPFLQSLDLTSCVNLTATGWGELLKLPQLYRLNLTRCSQITDSQLSVILDAAVGLVELELEDCGQLTASGFQHFSRSSRQLEVLNLARTGISDASLIMLAEQQKSLRRLNLANCSHITEKGIAETLRLAAALEELNFIHGRIDENVVDELRIRYPRVKIFS